MSAYEDIGLSYVSLNESTYGKMQFATPIGASEAFVVAVKFRASGIATNSAPAVFCVGVGNASFNGGIYIEGNAADGRVSLNHCAQGTVKTINLSSVSGSSVKLSDLEDHIVIVSVPAGAGTLQMWADQESKNGTNTTLSGFTAAPVGITLNGRQNVNTLSTAPVSTSTGLWEISWLAVYSSLDVNGRAALFAGASPLTVGTLRSGDSFWDFDGDGNEYNGGTPFTFTGTPTFVQPAYPDTLEVTESYLSLDSTQYAQVPIGATRLATFGDGVDLYGTIPVWTATNWEIEFDIVFPTTAASAIYYVFDSNADSNRRNFAIGPAGSFTRTTSNYQAYLDGSLITFGTTQHSLDGAVHHIKLVSDAGTNPTTVGKILTRYSNANYGNMAIFNLSLKDLDTPANSRFYPMDETIAVSSFADTSANLQHGTWYNRVAGDVKTVYPSAIKPAQEFWIACKYKIVNVSGQSYPRIFAVGSNASNQVYLTGLDSSTRARIERVCAGGTDNGANYNSAYSANGGVDGISHIVITRITSTQIQMWIDAITNTATDTSLLGQFSAPLTHITINADSALSGKVSTNINYFYLYNTLSPADITALMQGEHPASVGNVRQGYNLAGDGDEVNGGPALTLYNSPRFVVPNRVGLTRPLVSRLVSSLTSSLVAR